MERASGHGWGGQAFSLPPRCQGWRGPSEPGGRRRDGAWSSRQPYAQDMPARTSSRPESLLQLPGPVRLGEHPGRDTEAPPSGHLTPRPVWVGVGLKGELEPFRPPNMTVGTATDGTQARTDSLVPRDRGKSLPQLAALDS